MGGSEEGLSSGASWATPRILNRTKRWVAISKPAGMPSQPDLTGDLDALTWLRGTAGSETAGLVHRLDRPVSGVMVFALDDVTLAALNVQFSERRVAKHYWAIVEGVVDGARVLENVIAQDGKRNKAVVGRAEHARSVSLAIRPMAKGDRYCLLEVVPDGGAFHQIRAQLGAAGNPIKGDVKYGARRGEKDRSIALHARSLEFDDPSTEQRVQVTAPHPVSTLWSALVGLSAEP